MKLYTISQICAFMIVDFSLALLEERLRMWQVLSSFHPPTKSSLRRLKLRRQDLANRKTDSKKTARRSMTATQPATAGLTRGNSQRNCKARKSLKANIAHHLQLNRGSSRLQPRHFCILAFHFALNLRCLHGAGAATDYGKRDLLVSLCFLSPTPCPARSCQAFVLNFVYRRGTDLTTLPCTRRGPGLGAPRQHPL